MHKGRQNGKFPWGKLGKLIFYPFLKLPLLEKKKSSDAQYALFLCTPIICRLIRASSMDKEASGKFFLIRGSYSLKKKTFEQKHPDCHTFS